MRFFSIILGFIFLLFAAFQVNDPDPVLWIILYLVPAATSFILTYKYIHTAVLVLMFTVYLVGSIIIFPESPSQWLSIEQETKAFGMKLPGIEEGRESMGLLICSLTFLGYAFYNWRNHYK